MIALLWAALVLQTPARAESLLAAGRIDEALRTAQRVVWRNPRDARAHLLLGRVHFARRVIGRYPALEEFQIAAHLAPADPEPLYWQMKIGFYLRSDEGDVTAREALLRLFAVTPDYADAWKRFRDVYQNPDIWRRAERAFAVHGDDVVALERRAELLIALNDGVRADSLLAIVMSRRPPTAATCLLRAEAAFLAGRERTGYAWHDSALARANADSTGALWDEVWLIASPEETARHAATPPGERRAFLERFWKHRDPNLLTSENERLREHYARRAETRRMYRLLHPQRMSYHSPLWRALANFERQQQLLEWAERAPYEIPGASSDTAAVMSRVASLSLRSLQDTALDRAFRAGLTAQGLVFLRHGAPDRHASCIPDLRRPVVLYSCTSHLDEESWLYMAPDGPLSIRFEKNEYFAPISRDQIRSAHALLQTDRTTLPAPLRARAWTAVFRSAELGVTDVYYKAAGDSTAAVLWNAAGDPLRASGPGLLQLTVPPGRYELGLDVDSGGVLGRIRREVVVPSFSYVDLELSSLALAPAATLLDRETTLRDMPADLTYPAARSLAVYVEIYGLTTDRDGRSQYRVRYAFEPVRSLGARLVGGAARTVVFEFDREVTSSSTAEQLVIEPGELPAGRYRVTLAVTDGRRNVKSESVALDITIH
jgi:hypothetical protein